MGYYSDLVGTLYKIYTVGFFAANAARKRLVQPYYIKYHLAIKMVTF